jgi:hypothetical protein
MINLPNRIYSQYRSKPKLVDWMNIARKLGGDIGSAAQAVRSSYDIDTATGEQLDVLARIVVIDRGFIANIPLDQHRFKPDSDTQTRMGGSATMSAKTASSDTLMSDGILRIAIKAKIAKNNGDATITSILKQMMAIAPGIEYLSVIDNQNMTFAIEFSGEVDILTRWALFNADLIQRPQGVELLGVAEATGVYRFAPIATAVRMGASGIRFRRNRGY